MFYDYMHLNILHGHTVHIFIHVIIMIPFIHMHRFDCEYVNGNSEKGSLSFLHCISFALAKVGSTRWSYPCMATHPPFLAQDKVLCGKNSERHCSSVSLIGQPMMINWSLKRRLINCPGSEQ